MTPLSLSLFLSPFKFSIKKLRSLKMIFIYFHSVKGISGIRMVHPPCLQRLCVSCETGETGVIRDMRDSCTSQDGQTLRP